jgi:hypothetical protein
MGQFITWWGNIMETAKIMQIAGLAIVVLGVILLRIGTTSMGLFIFYGIITVGGAALAAGGRKLQDKR